MNEIFLEYKKELKNCKKDVIHWEKLNFQHIRNSVHTAEFFVLAKALNFYINYSMSYPGRKYVK